ncbi:MAG: lipid A biosynthesis acyltransferase [Chlorobi bacterium]|nr:lipid A biosynthesis acyltransferase [Chlorobiota bacterium]
MKRLGRALSYGLFAPLAAATARMPLGGLYKISDALFHLLYRYPGYRREVVDGNLAVAFPDKSEAERREIGREFYRHLADLLVETAKTAGMSRRELARRFRMTNPELMNRYYDQGRSVIIYGGHQGNWEWIFGLGDELKHKKMAVYKPLSNPWIDRHMRRTRSKFRFDLVPTYDTYRFIAAKESRGEPYAYGFLGDQNPLPHKAKLWLPFFGKEVPVQTGAEAVARKYDLPVLFMEIRKTGRGFYEADLSLITDRPKETEPFWITRTYFKMLEESIRRQPPYYYWIHRRFKHARS